MNGWIPVESEVPGTTRPVAIILDVTNKAARHCRFIGRFVPSVGWVDVDAPFEDPLASMERRFSAPVAYWYDLPELEE